MDSSNPNNTAYIEALLFKHFLKVAASIVFAVSIICSPFLLVNFSLRRAYLFLLSITLYSAALIDFAHIILYQSSANSSSYFSLFSSNKYEALEFIQDYSAVNLWLGIAVFIIIPLLIYYVFEKQFGTKIKNVLFCIYLFCYAVIAFFIFTVSDTYHANEISAVKLWHAYIDYKDEIKTLNTIEGSQPFSAVKKELSDNETYIVVIGESTSKYHMQLYGYDRGTNPKLSAIKEELIVFENVKTNHAHTIASLKDVLVLKDSNGVSTTNTLVDCFNKTGFKTYWLSNQQFLGENQTLVSAIANRAHQKVFISPTGKSKLDEELLPELDRIIAEKNAKKVIFIHLMGTHLSYQDRYPNSFNIFKDKNISVFGDHADSFVNTYDNAIAYNDSIVYEITRRVNAVNGAGAMIYFSDHGDEVYDFRDFHGHSQTLLSKYMTSIPFIIYCNKAYLKAKSKSLKAYRTNVRQEFSLSDVSHTLHDLFEIESDYFDRSKSCFSKKATRDARHDTAVLGFDYFQPLPVYGNKIWVHRVNSIERLKLVEDKFEGMELDIVFENGHFDVGHPPVKSIGLSLDDFFENVRNIKAHYFWLDLKNLNESNKKEVIERLNYLTNKFHIKNNIIVETSHSNAIPDLKKEEYYTSYYLPNINTSSTIEIQKIKNNALKHAPNAVSQSINSYKAMQQLFGNANKLIWALNLDWNEPANHKRIESLLAKDTTIKVCLVNYHTKGWR